MLHIDNGEMKMAKIKKRSYSGVVADLAAANREVRQVMDENRRLKEDQGRAADAVRKEATKALAGAYQLIEFLSAQVKSLYHGIAKP